MKIINGFIIALMVVFVSQVNAQIYKCENKSGKVFYNDKPCPVYEKETQIKAVKDPKKGYIPPAFVEDIEQDESSVVVVGNDEKNRDLKSNLSDTSKGEQAKGGASHSSSTKKTAPSQLELSSTSGRVPYSQTKNKETQALTNKKTSPLKRVKLKVENREY